ncbi:protein translocase subunit SecDF, partial [Staphylococcus aureus]|nr:protein translocase subunit SecDF [Staphylococcus aureus]
KQALTQPQVEHDQKDSGLTADQIQITGKYNKVATVQFKDYLTRAQDNKFSDNIKSKFGDKPQINTVSPIIGQELAKNSM